MAQFIFLLHLSLRRSIICVSVTSKPIRLSFLNLLKIFDIFSWGRENLLKFYLFFVLCGWLSALMYLSVHGGHQVFRDKSYRWLWTIWIVLGIESGFLWKINHLSNLIRKVVFSLTISEVQVSIYHTTPSVHKSHILCKSLICEFIN